MLSFEYTARDESSGEKIQATVQADSEAAASKLIAKQGLSPISIKLKGESKSVFARFRDRVSTKDKVLFSRQLSTLIGSGLPLVQSLRSVQEQTSSKPFQLVVAQVIADVESGTAFAKSLKKHPKIFNNVYVSIVEAGESSGTLDDSLERLADQQEKDAEITGKVKGALVYPAIVLVVIMMVVIFMLTTVLPQVELLYEDLGEELPFVTSFMLFFSRLLINYWYFFILGVLGSAYALFRYFQTTGGTEVGDSLKMNTPILGRLFMKLYMARFTSTGGTLLKSGVQMLEMMKITGSAVNNVHIKRATEKASHKVKAGTALSDAIDGDQNFLPLVPQMIRIGEQSGSLDEMMMKTAIYYEGELDREVKAISTIIEPVLMVVLALVAGLMVAAILIPIYGLVGSNGVNL